jgi:hypothetical protein
MMFRSGYKKDFPCTTTDDNTIHAALAKDRERRIEKGKTANASNHRKHTEIAPNQIVFVRNNIRNKFDPIFGPTLHKVINVQGNGAFLHRQSDGKILRRHLDDIKPVSSAEEETCWINDHHLPTPEAPIQGHNTAAPEPPLNNVRPQRDHRLPAHLRDDVWVMNS